MSKSKKIQTVYADIWDYLEELGIEEVRHYYKEFKREPDYNLAQYGEMRISYWEVRELYANAGYKNMREVYKRAPRTGDAARGDYKISDDEVWNIYKYDVGYVVREFLRVNG